MCPAKQNKTKITFQLHSQEWSNRVLSVPIVTQLWCVAWFDIENGINFLKWPSVWRWEKKKMVEAMAGNEHLLDYHNREEELLDLL